MPCSQDYRPVCVSCYIGMCRQQYISMPHSLTGLRPLPAVAAGGVAAVAGRRGRAGKCGGGVRAHGGRGGGGRHARAHRGTVRSAAALPVCIIAPGC